MRQEPPKRRERAKIRVLPVRQAPQATEERLPRRQIQASPRPGPLMIDALINNYIPFDPTPVFVRPFVRPCSEACA